MRIVFLGYHPEQLNMTDFKAWLPRHLQARREIPQYYGLQGRDTGLMYDFRYDSSSRGRSSPTGFSAP